MGYAADTLLVGEFPVLSLFTPSSEDDISVIDAQPISYSLPPRSSSSTVTCDLSSIDSGEDGNSPFFYLSLFPEVTKKKPSNPTLSLFPQVSENLADSKPVGNNTPPPLPTTPSVAAALSTDLCLSLPYTPDTASSTITTLQCSIGTQHSSAKRSLFQETGDDKFVPLKKIKRLRVILRPPAVVPVSAVEGEKEGHWIIKLLKKSDADGASRLLLPRQDVKNYVLPLMKVERQAIICNELSGVDVKVYDMDTQTEHLLTLKKWATNSFQLVKGWTTEFVRRRNLKEDDVTFGYVGRKTIPDFAF